MWYFIQGQSFYIFQTENSYSSKVWGHWITADSIDELVDSINDYIYRLIKQSNLEVEE